MNGSQINQTERQQILTAMQTPPKNGYFVWDEQDEEERPLTREEMLAGMVINSTQIELQLDNDILNYFRSTGIDWQMKINHALREWVKEHSIV